MLLLLLRLVLFLLLRAALDDVEELPLLRLHELLALRPLLLVPKRLLVVGTGDVGHLYYRCLRRLSRRERPVADCDDVEVVAAHERDVSLVAREACRRFA